MIDMKNIHKTYGKKGSVVQALQGVDVHISKGEMVAIMGKSGSGKSTLLNIMGSLIPYDQGSYIFDNNKIDFGNHSSLLQFRRQRIGFVVQYFALIEDMTVFSNIALPLRYQRLSLRSIRKKVIDMMSVLAIQDKEKADPKELSGGQQQRVAIARALIKDPDVLLADEPTGALDEQTENEILDLFMQLHQEGRTIVIVTHDKNVAGRCDRIIYLRDGRVVV
jgi:putative ABC transport system ATP-binding protein